jgi:hypothetical protein
MMLVAHGWLLQRHAWRRLVDGRGRAEQERSGERSCSIESGGEEAKVKFTSALGSSSG